MRGISAFLQPLEGRQLLSTVNVLKFGATPNDGRDDSAAIRAAINNSSNGDTIYFPKGTYTIGSTINLAGNRNYIGAAGATLKGQPSYHIFEIHADNIEIENLVLDGKGITIDKPNNQMVNGLVINNNTFHVHATGDGYNGITFTTGLQNSVIANNTFDPIDGDNGIYGYNWNNLKIANNAFKNGHEGIHLTDFINVSSNLLIEQNYFTGLSRMGVEIQGGGIHTVVQDNYYENPVMTSNFHDNDSTFAYSIIADRSSGSIIQRNTAIAPKRPDGTGVRIVFEVGGDNTLVQENYSVGSNNVLAANDGVGSTSVLARDNKWSDYLEGPGGRGLTLVNNGANVKLDWNVNRGKPGPNKRLGLDGYISTSASAAKKARPAAVAAPAKTVYLSDLNWNSASNGSGPIGKNQRTVGSSSIFGSTMKIAATSYKKGLATAIDSEIVYNLNGKYAKFFSDVGIDNQGGKTGSETFEVFADGKKIYDSGVMHGGQPAKTISLNIRNVRQLKLVTIGDKYGKSTDLADWGNARVSLA